MKTKLALAASVIILLAALVGQAVAGPTITDKRYWPNEAGLTVWRQGNIYPSDKVIRARNRQDARSEKTCRYQGGPKNNLVTCN